MSKFLAIRSLMRSSLLRLPVQRRFNRCFNNFGDPRKYERCQEVFRKKDKIPSEFALIYRNKIESYVVIVSAISVSAMLFGTAVLIGIFVSEETAEAVPEEIVDLEPSQTDSVESLVMSCLSFYVIFAVLMYYFRKFPLRVYNYKDQYISVTPGYVPFSRSKLLFSLSDVEPPEEPVRRFISFAERSYDFDGRKALLVDEYFRAPSDVAKLTSRK